VGDDRPLQRHLTNAVDRIREHSDVEFWPHDLRRTAATAMTSGGVPRLIVSRILNHADGGVTAIYDRASYDAEKRAALDWWAIRLQGILEQRDAKILPFQRGA
jgi:integrase